MPSLLRQTAERLTQVLGSWHTATWLFRSYVTRAVVLIPLLGWAIIWSNYTRRQIEEFLSFNMAFPGGWLTWETRLELLYVGSTLMLLGMFVYYAFCPAIPRRYPHLHDYWDFAIRIRSPSVLGSILQAGFTRNHSFTDDRAVTVADVNIYGAVSDLMKVLSNYVDDFHKPRLNKLADALEAEEKIVFISLTTYDDTRFQLTRFSYIIYDETPLRGALTHLLDAYHAYEGSRRRFFAFVANVYGYSGAALFYLPSVEICFRAFASLLRI